MKKGFTIAEIIVTVTITLILATIAIATYTQTVDNARQRVCASNQTVLLKAVENYFLTTGVAPATLGDLSPEQVHKAYVEVMQNRDWLTKLAFFVTKFSFGHCAHAQIINNLSELVTPAVMQSYGVAANAFQCPADTGGGISYGINGALRGYSSWADVPDSLQIIADCDSYILGTPAARHKARLGTQEISISVTKSGEIIKGDTYPRINDRVDNPDLRTRGADRRRP